MRYFVRCALLCPLWLTLALAGEIAPAQENLSPPPPFYAGIKELYQAAHGDSRGAEKARRQLQGMGDEAMPALERLFDEEKDLASRGIITRLMLTNGSDRQRTIEFLKSRFPGDVNQWGDARVLAVASIISRYDGPTGRELGLKALASTSPEVHSFAISALTHYGKEEDIRLLERKSAQKRRSDRDKAAAEVPPEVADAITSIRERAKRLREEPPGYSEIRVLIQPGNDMDVGPFRRFRSRRGFLRIFRMGDGALPAWGYALDQPPESNINRYAVVVAMLSSGADPEKMAKLLISKFPADVADWGQAWVSEAIKGIAAHDAKLGCELAWKAQGSSQAIERDRAMMVLWNYGTEEDVQRLKAEIERQRGGDPDKPLDNTGNAAVRVIAEIEKRLAQPPPTPEETDAKVEAALREYVHLPPDKDRSRQEAALAKMGTMTLPACERLFDEQPGDELLRAEVTKQMLPHRAENKEAFAFLKSKLPAEVADWKEPWIAEMIRDLEWGSDFRIAREMALKELGAPGAPGAPGESSESARVSAVEALGEVGRMEDIPVLREIVDRQRGGDPFKALDATGQAALNAMGEIRAADGVE